MGKNHEACQRGFYLDTESWWYRPEPDRVAEIGVGMYCPEGGTTGEFAIRWTPLAGKVVPRLEAFDDSWSALCFFGDLLAWMASVDDENVGPQAFATALRGMGIKDMTQRTNPRTSPAEREYASWFNKT